jgi:hypothetical protein
MAASEMPLLAFLELISLRPTVRPTNQVDLKGRGKMALDAIDLEISIVSYRFG